jgi:hypothetical protein
MFHDQWVTEEIKEEIKEFLELRTNGTQQRQS